MALSTQLNSQQLLEVLNLVKEAAAIYTSEEIIIEMANDAMLAFWDKDQSIIGLPLAEAVPALKGQPFIGMLQKVWRTGETDAGLAIPAELLINGELQTNYFDYEYRAIFNEQGEVYCILHTASDVTERVLGMQAMDLAKRQEKALFNEQALNEELHAINEELSETQEQLHNINLELEERVLNRTRLLSDREARLLYMLRDAPLPIAVFFSRDQVIESANNKMLEAWGKTADIIGKPLKEALPELKGQAFLTVLDEVYTSGEPYFGIEEKALVSRNGLMEEVYANYVYQPLKDEDGRTTSIMLIASMVTEQVKARKLTEANEQQWRFMLNAIPQQVWTAKPNGELDYVNQVVCTDFGEDTDEIVGQGWQKYIHPDDLPKALALWQDSLSTGKAYVVEFRLLFADGLYHWHLARALPFMEEEEIKQWVGTNTNIEAQKEKEQKKDEFISIASHELKTPLTSIKAFNQLMGRAKEKDKLDTYIHKSAEHIAKLEKLIYDLLDVTKINAGKMSYAMQPFDFTAMVKESIENVQHSTQTHEILLTHAEPIIYNGDHFRLEQVVNNFLTNAIKYSPQANKIEVSCSITNANIVVSVKDFGIGIETASLDKLFDRYYRVDNTAMRFEGLGLGLFISSEILKRHRGSFWIESELGQGSTFYFRLPLTDETAHWAFKSNEDFYKDEQIIIAYHEDYRRLDVDWTGFQDIDSVQRGGMKILEFIKKYQVIKACNDNSNVLGTWSEAVDWAGNEFFPLLEQAGLHYLAWVYPPSVFNKLSAEKTVEIAQGNIITQFFTSVKAAHEWLDSK